MGTEMKPFDLVDAVGYTKVDLFTEDPIGANSAYNAWLTNKHFSNFIDSLFYANDMNMVSDLPKDMQFRYYLAFLPSRKRFAKWNKPKEDDRIDSLMTYYGINRSRAKEALRVLKPDEVDEIVKIVRSGDREGAGRAAGNRTEGS